MREARRVLVGFAESLAAPECVWSLEDAGFQVTAFSRRSARPALRRLRSVELLPVTAPEEDLPRALAELEEILTATNPAALLPLDDASLYLAGRVRRLGTTALTAPGDPDRLALAFDKRCQTEAAAEAGFTVPPTMLVTDRSGLDQISRFPCIVKPASAVSSVGVRLVRGAARTCTTRDELERAVDSLLPYGPLLVQDLIPGHGEGLFGLSRDGRATAWSAHRRLRMMNPAGSGSSACASMVPERRAVACAERLVAAAGWTGPFMVEMLRDPAGELHFIEFNGRPWGSMALARRAGFEYPAWAVQAALGQPASERTPAPVGGIRARHLGRDLVHLMFVLRGHKSHPNWPSRTQTAAEVLAVRRGDRLYNWRRGHLDLFAADTVRTVADAVSHRGRRR